jgi:biopolymer transport protein ExbB
MRRQRMNVGWLAAGAVTCLITAAPVWAQEEAHAGGSSYASRFLTTDNPLGTALVWICLLVSVAIVSLIIQNALQARSSVYMPPELVNELERLINEKNYREAIDRTAEDPSPFGRIMRAALSEAPRGYAAMETAIEETADEYNNRKVRSLVWLEIAGAAGPMIGLFGTVFGMILSFYKLLEAGGSPKAQELAGGIATALVCTFWGLVVGIPGVIAASLYRVKYEGLTADGIHRAKQLIATFRPGSAGKKPATGTPAPAATTPASPKPVPA